MSSVGVGDERSEVIDRRCGGTLSLWHGETSVALFAVVEELGHPKMMDFVRYGCLLRVSIGSW
jgi:hypothetical protein